MKYSSNDSENKKKVLWSETEAVILMQKYCAVQDRCHAEVRTKLLEHGIYGDVLEEIISDLISEGFLDEERFAKSYVRGKFRMKGWGRIKIVQELKFRKISEYSIREGLKEIHEPEYWETLERLYQKKLMTIQYKDKYDLYRKMSAYLMSKGYEYEMIKEVLSAEE